MPCTPMRENPWPLTPAYSAGCGTAAGLEPLDTPNTPLPVTASPRAPTPPLARPYVPTDDFGPAVTPKTPAWTAAVSTPLLCSPATPAPFPPVTPTAPNAESDPLMLTA